jgi:uncharacterized protein involved in exopolysaccharide biosynthesis
MEKSQFDNALQDKVVIVRRHEHNPLVNLRELAATGFRHGRTLSICFSGILALAVIVAVLVPRKYESEAKILIMHQRADPVLTPGAQQVQTRDGTTPEEMNSEVELIQSEDLARRVVIDCGLAPAGRNQWERDRNIARAVAIFRSHLKVEVLHKTNVISIVYSARSPDLSQRVVNDVVTAYLQKHVAVHDSSELAFFDQQVSKYHEDLEKAETALGDFSQRKGGAVSPEAQREALLQKQSEFGAILEQTRSQISETRARNQMLENEAEREPDRVTTQVRKLDNPQLLQDLKATLLKLELRRTELTSKYKPTYPLVQEVDQEITKTQAAIASAESSPLRDQTTDMNPIRQWIDSELAKGRAELRSLQSKADNLTHVVAEYDRQARAMDEQQLQYADLLRNSKSAEENYLLYVRKREEARITNTLDQSRILNVRVIQPATSPFLPTQSRIYFLALGLVVAFAATAGLLLALEHVDNTFRNPHQIERFLQIPVLATLPVEATLIRAINRESQVAEGIE